MTDLDTFDLDTNLDEVADLVQFVNPHDGTHIFGIIYAGEDKVGTDKRGVKIVYQLLKTLEKANPDEPEAPVGSLCNESFTGNEKGKEFLKMRIKQLFGEATGRLRPYLDLLNSNDGGRQQVKLTTKMIPSTVKKPDGTTVTYSNLRIVDAVAIEAETLPEDFDWYEYKPAEADAA